MKSSSHITNRSNGPPYAQSVVSMEIEDGISYQGWCKLIVLTTYTSQVKICNGDM